MRKLLIAATLLAGPAQAAELDGPAYRGPHATAGAGAWGGVRFRAALGARGGVERVRAGVALAPTSAARRTDGASLFRRGEGLELSMTDRGAPRLTLAGFDLARRRAAGGEGARERRGPSTALLVVGGVVVAAVIGGLLFADALNDASE